MHKLFFTFRRLSVFTVSFTSNADNETICTVLLSSQVVLVQSLQPKGPEFESTHFFCCIFTSLFDSFNFIIIDVPRPLSNVFWIIIFKRLMRNAYTEPDCLEHIPSNRTVNVIKRLKPLFLNPYFQFCKYSNTSKLFVYTCICYCYLCRTFTKNVYRTLDM